MQKCFTFFQIDFVISHVNVLPRHGDLNVTFSYCICILVRTVYSLSTLFYSERTICQISNLHCLICASLNKDVIIIIIIIIIRTCSLNIHSMH